MLKVLLIDDEQYILNGLSRLINWKDYGYEIVGLCSKASEALEVARQTRPDLIILDIEMPGMSGLELMEQLNSALVRATFVILSAYDLFEYAQEAIRLGAYQYLLKPINRGKLIALLEETKVLTEKRQEEERSRRDMAEAALSQDRIIASYLLSEVLLGGRREWDDGRKKLYQELYGTFSFRLYFAHAEKQAEEDWESEFMKMLQPAAVLHEPGATVFVCPMAQDALPAEGKTAGVTVGIGEWKVGLFEAEVFYQRQLRQFFQELFFAKEEAFFHIRRVPIPADSEHGAYLIAVEEAVKNPLLHAVRSLDEKGAGICVDTIFKKLAENRSEIPVGAIRHFLKKLVEEISGKLLGILQEEGQDTAAWPTFEPETFFHLECLHQELLRIFPQMIATIGASGVGRGTLIYQVQEYVKEHYADNTLKLSKIAELLYVNYSYLSYIFKKETGGNFHQYLLGIRMEEACRLLKETQLAVAQVAVRVGYPDSKNFYHAFKKKTGVSPNRYRNSSDEL